MTSVYVCLLSVLCTNHVADGAGLTLVQHLIRLENTDRGIFDLSFWPNLSTLPGFLSLVHPTGFGEKGELASSERFLCSYSLNHFTLVLFEKIEHIEDAAGQSLKAKKSYGTLHILMR